MALIKPITSLSISIVCYDSPKEHLLALFESLRKSILRVSDSFEFSFVKIYLIDNSKKKCLDLKDVKALQIACETSELELSYLHGHGNIGYGRAHNLILEKLNSRYHLILNPDIVLDEDALLASIRILDDDSKIAMLSPSALDFSGEKQYLCKRYPSIFTLFIRGIPSRNLKKLFVRRLDKYEMRELPETGSSVSVPIVSGCFMFVRAEFFRKLNGFDKKYFLYFEDFDLSLRMAKLGKLVFAPEVRINHDGGNASRKGFRHLGYFVGSGLRFFNSYGWSFF